MKTRNEKKREILDKLYESGVADAADVICAGYITVDQALTQLNALDKPRIKVDYVVDGLINVFGKIRLDTRWTKEDYFKKMRKGERIVKFKIDRFTPSPKKQRSG